MKRYIWSLLALALLLTACKKDFLDKEPNAEISSSTLLATTENAQTALNGIYASLYKLNDNYLWTHGNVQQNCGIPGFMLTADLMGDDFVQHERGSGWFYFDYNFVGRIRHINPNWRSYGLWNYFYKLIANANLLISGIPTMEGTQTDVAKVNGQALALRAFAYYYLSLFFQQTYVGHEHAQGVPLYTEPTTANSVAKGRGTMQELYAQILQDLQNAEKMLKPTMDDDRELPTEINYYIVKGLQARVYLTMGMFEEAAQAAHTAREMVGDVLLPIDGLNCGMSDLGKIPSAMWGATVVNTETEFWGNYYNHMDAGAGAYPADNDKKVVSAHGYGVRSRKCVDKSLYDRMTDGDERQTQWWKGPVDPEQPNGPMVSYVQRKFRFKDVASATGDFVFMRAEEMLLIEAEALCRQRTPDEAKAKDLLKELYKVRYKDPSARTTFLTGLSGNTITPDAHAVPATLLDEIIFQRRVELWGEVGRAFDIKRLGQTMVRKYPGSNHSFIVDLGVNDKRFVFPIPDAEFDGNKALDKSKDQNPD